GRTAAAARCTCCQRASGKAGLGAGSVGTLRSGSESKTTGPTSEFSGSVADWLGKLSNVGSVSGLSRASLGRTTVSLCGGFVLGAAPRPTLEVSAGAPQIGQLASLSGLAAASHSWPLRQVKRFGIRDSHGQGDIELSHRPAPVQARLGPLLDRRLAVCCNR